MMVAWQRINRSDTLFLEALRHPGETLRATADGPEGYPPFVPEVAAHARRYRMEHVLGTVHADPTLGLIEGIALYRADAGRPFTEPERLLTQQLVPHLAETWRLNRLRAVHPEKRSQVVSRMSLAICDRKGLLHTAGPGFAETMQSEWPEWHGPSVSTELLGAGRKPYLGHRISVSIEPINDLWLLKLRRRSPLDGLSRRELEVANRYGRGMNYQDIAQALHLAPATVRNHLKNIYGKLGIGNKVELAKLLG
jgi:DNA-binding CsgD family transcriptional regulator